MALYQFTQVGPNRGSGGNLSVGGDNKQVQFNDQGRMGASSNFVYDKANIRLGIGTSTPLLTLDVRGSLGITQYLKIANYGTVSPSVDNGDAVLFVRASGISPNREINLMCKLKDGQEIIVSSVLV